MISQDTIVIGAGISGLLCAQALKDEGVSVTVLEKSKGVGGRMATRRFAGGVADHGAQLFTSRDLRFQMIVNEWLEAKVCKRWYVSEGNELGAQGYVRYCGFTGMTDAAKWIAQSLDIHFETQVEKACYDPAAKNWTIWVNEAPAYQCQSLVLTAPLPQSLAILEAGNSPFEISLHDELKGIRYQRSLTLIARLDGPAAVSPSGALRVGKPPITWIGDNQAKGISPQVPIITIHTTAAFADQYWNAPDDERVPILLNAAAPHLNAKVVEWECHRWGYSFPLNPWHELHIEDPERSLYLAGDAFGGPRIEGAALSGLMAAATFVNRRSRRR